MATTILEQSTLEQKIQLVKGRFHYRGWITKNAHRYRGNICMVFHPSFREYCYFITFLYDGSIWLLPKEDNNHFKEAKTIVEEALKR
jgi:hypothetical protein